MGLALGLGLRILGCKGVGFLRKGHGLGLGVGLVYCTCARKWVFCYDVTQWEKITSMTKCAYLLSTINYICLIKASDFDNVENSPPLNATWLSRIAQAIHRPPINKFNICVNKP